MKEVAITVGFAAVALTLVLVVHDNMPNGFSFKKKAA